MLLAADAVRAATNAALLASAISGTTPDRAARSALAVGGRVVEELSNASTRLQ